MALVVVSLSPFLVGAVSRIRGMGASDISGDQALIALDVREVGSHAVELVVAVSSVTRVVGGIEYHLVEWISAIGLVLWIACGGAAIALA